MEPLHIVGNTDHCPFPSPAKGTAGIQSLYLLDDSKYRFHRGLAFGVDRLAFQSQLPTKDGAVYG